MKQLKQRKWAPMLYGNEPLKVEGTGEITKAKRIRSVRHYPVNFSPDNTLQCITARGAVIFTFNAYSLSCAIRWSHVGTYGTCQRSLKCVVFFWFLYFGRNCNGMF